jgi:uncharacterized protein (TIGR02996 family)
MNDDEAFIRAIVAAPGDDAPRLVYADWLDERGDPRGSYLRLEAEIRRDRPDVFGAGKWLAKAHYSIDNMWLNRVTRPPLGVCPDQVRFRDAGPPLTGADLERVERELGFRLPWQYGAFLLNYNGGVPEPGQFVLEGQEPEERSEVEWLLRIGAEGPGRNLPLERVVANLRRAGAAGPVNNDLLPIGNPVTQDDMLFIGVTDLLHGPVYYFNDYTHFSYDAENLIEIAPSFGQFLAMLGNYDPDWVQLIAAGDVAAVERWLDYGGDVDEIDPGTGCEPLYHAVWSSQPAMVRLLLEWGATVPGEILSTARQHGNREIIQLLTAHRRGQG